MFQFFPDEQTLPRGNQRREIVTVVALFLHQRTSASMFIGAVCGNRSPAFSLLPAGGRRFAQRLIFQLATRRDDIALCRANPASFKSFALT